MDEAKKKNYESSDYPGFEIDEDYRFKRRDWIFQRIGWAGMVVVILAAMSGVFSVGPLSKITVRDPARAVEIDYERFQRLEASSDITIRILPKAESPTIRLLLQGALLEDFDITALYPSPSRSVLTDAGWLLEFPASSLPAAIRITAIPQKFGHFESLVGVDGQAPALVKMLVYP